MPEILAAIIPLIPEIVKLGQVGIGFITALRATAIQSKQWTPEAETAFLESLITYGNSRGWKTDAELAAENK